MSVDQAGSRWNCSGFRSIGLLALTGGGLAAGAAAYWLSGSDWAARIWGGLIVLMLTVLAAETLRALRHGKAGVDLLALLTMLGALALGEYLAGAVIAFMLASGRALEAYAGARARRELTALLARTPQSAHRRRGAELEDVAVDAVIPGDRLLVKPGEVVPVDGLLLTDSAVLDESALTGEPMPRSRVRGERLASGVVNAGQPFELEALATAAASTYAGVVRLVQQAQAGRAPFTRLADRYALLFVPLALGLAGLAWLISGEPLRALAVLVVATPCPLILAAPAALVSAISCAARRGVLVKDGGALEQLAQVEVVMFDKTGTLTSGQARLAGIETSGTLEATEVLRLAASVDQVSQHALAQALVGEARRRGLPLSLPRQVREQPGAGLEGEVDGRQVKVGTVGYVTGEAEPQGWMRQALQRLAYGGGAGVFVAVDDRPAGALLLADQIRLDTARALRALRQAGIRRTVMVSGDHRDVAETIAAALGIDTVLAECTPADKVAAVAAERKRAVTAMVGDGINDAPALAAADVGVAMGARGAAASAEAADVVLLVDRLDRLADGLQIARRGRAIALQSVVVGMGLSGLAMLVAAMGYLPVVAGALLQEGIDVAVIANALRALTPGRRARRFQALPPAVVARLREEHGQLEPLLDRIKLAADALDALAPEQARAELHAVGELLRSKLLPHEREDEETLYPQLAGLLQGVDPMAAMSRTHREIFRLARRFQGMLDTLPQEPLSAMELSEFRRLLYSLEALLRLNFAQEEEVFQTVAA